MREADLYAPIIKGANSEGMFLFRIADGTFGKKPYDIAGFTSSGVAVGIEVKLVRRFPDYDQKIPKSIFSPHQIVWLNNLSARLGLAVVVLGHHSGQVRAYRLWRPYRWNDASTLWPNFDMISRGEGTDRMLFGLSSFQQEPTSRTI